MCRVTRTRTMWCILLVVISVSGGFYVDAKLSETKIPPRIKRHADRHEWEDSFSDSGETAVIPIPHPYDNHGLRPGRCIRLGQACILNYSARCCSNKCCYKGNYPQVLIQYACCPTKLGPIW